MMVSRENFSIPQLSLIPPVIIMRVVVLVIKVRAISHAPSVMPAVRAPVPVRVHNHPVGHMIVKQPDASIGIELRSQS